MKKASISERLNYYIRHFNTTQSNILKKAEEISESQNLNVKINKNDLSQYVAGKVEPGSKKLVLLSLAMNVNESWLLGYDVPMERFTDKDPIYNISEELQRKISRLNDDQKKIILNVIDNMK